MGALTMDGGLSTGTVQTVTVDIHAVTNVVESPGKCSCLSCALCPRKSDCIWVSVAVEERYHFGRIGTAETLKNKNIH